MIIGIAAMLTLLTSVSIPASVYEKDYTMHKHDISTTNVTAQGAHCNGTVGCSCPGFSPITNGDVWQQAYCRHCGHARRSHK